MFRRLFLIASLFFISSLTFAQTYVSTFSGNGVQGFINGPTDSATFKSPFGLCRDRMGNIFIADGNNCIRKIDFFTGIVSTYAGTGVAGFKDGPADSAQFNSPADLCVDDSGNVFVSDFLNQRIRKINTNGIVSTIAGNGTAGFVDGSTNARFNYPRGICMDAHRNLYIGDSWNHRIRKIDVSGNVSTYAGGGSAIGVGSVGAFVDNADTSARFYTPSGLTIDLQGNIYVADAYNHRIRMIDTLMMVSTIAGSGSTGQGNGGYQDGVFGLSRLNTPTELFFDTLHNRIYFSDSFNNRIRIADFSTGSVSTLAGNGTAGYLNGIDTSAEFNLPRGLAADSAGDVYLCDYNNHSVRLISSNATVRVNEIVADNVKIYPNPSSDYFTIDFKKPGKYQIILYDFTGKLVVNRVVNTSNLTFDNSDINKGKYFLKIYSQGILISCRVVVIE